MTRRPLHWASPCEHSGGGWHVWMCFAHNKGWQQLGVLCLRCGARTYMSSAQWQLYDQAREDERNPRPAP